MKYLYLGFLLLFSFGIQAQSFDGKSGVSVTEAASFSENDLAEAFELNKISIKFELPEAFSQNPRILADQVRNSTVVSDKLKLYLTSEDQATRGALEQELLVYYEN